MHTENKVKNTIMTTPQKPRAKLVKPGSQSLLGKINQRFTSAATKVVPDVDSLQSVTEDVVENDTKDGANFQTLNIGPRKSKLFIRPPSARASVKSPRQKSLSPKEKDKPMTPISDNTANGVKLLKYLRKRSDRATFNGFDTNDASSLSPTASQRNQEPDDAPQRPSTSTAVQRIPSAKLRSPTVQAPAHSVLSAMFGSPSSPRSETMSSRTHPRDDNLSAAMTYTTPRKGSPLPSQTDEPIAAADGRPLSAKPQPSSSSQAYPTGTLASLFSSFSPRQDSAPAASEQATSLAEKDGSISSDVQRVPSAELRSPTVQVPTNSLLASLFNSFSPRKDSASAASENDDTLSETERPISAVQRVPSAKLRSPTVQVPTNNLLTSLFSSFSPRKDSASAASEDDDAVSEHALPKSQESQLPIKPEVDVSKPINNNTFNAPRRIGIGADSLVIPAKMEGLGLGRRLSGLTPRTPRSERSEYNEEDFYSPRGSLQDHEKDNDKDKHKAKNVPFVAATVSSNSSSPASPSHAMEDRLAKFRASVAMTLHPVSTATVKPPSTVIPEASGSKVAGQPPHISSSQAIEDRLARFRASVANKQSPVAVSNNESIGSAVQPQKQGIEERIQNYQKTIATLATRNPQTAIIDGYDSDMLSFDTAVSMSSAHPLQPSQPAPGRLSSKLLSKLFDAEEDDASQGSESYRGSTPAASTAATPPLGTQVSKPTTPIWLEPEQPIRRVDEQNTVHGNRNRNRESTVASYVPTKMIASDKDTSPQSSKPITPPLHAEGRAVQLHPRVPRASRVPRAVAGGGAVVSTALATVQATTTTTTTTTAAATTDQSEKKSRLPRRRPL